METCLATTLKEVVNDNTLPKLGIAFGKIKKASSYNDIKIALGKSVTITLPDNVDLWFNPSKTQKSKTFTGTGDSQYFSLYGNEDGVIDCEVVNYWNILKATGSLFGMSMKDWRFISSNNIEVGNGTSVKNRGLSFGNIEDLYQNTLLTTINANYCSVTGSVNTLADKMFAEGRISGSLAIYGTGTSMKKNGASFSNVTIAFTDSGWSFSS